MARIHDNYVWKLDMPSTRKLVMLALCKFADEEGHCYPSVATVARMTGITKRHCQRHMAELIGESFVAVVGNERGGLRSRDYMLSLAALRAAAGEGNGKPVSPVARMTPLRATSARKSRDTGVTRTTSLNFQQETPPPSARDVQALDWSGLAQFGANEKAVVVDLLKGIQAERRQDLVDELGGALRVNAIRGQWPGWLRAVARRAKEGEFVANHALVVQRDRLRVAREMAESEKRRAQAARRLDPETRVKNVAAMKAVLAELAKPSCGPKKPSGAGECV